jgi:protein CpxP
MSRWPGLRHLAALALLLPSLALAAPATTPAPEAPKPTGEAAAPSLSAAAQAAVDQRIQNLRSELGVTAAETPQWDAFAQAMRDNAARTDALFAERARSVATMNAVENMRSYAQIVRDYADSTERLANAFATLYASLTPAQREKADKLFREQATAPPRTRH